MIGHIIKAEASNNPEAYALQQARYFRYQSKPEAKAKSREAQKRRRTKYPDKCREATRRCERKRKLKRYGLTEESYKEMFLQQCSRCAICGTKERTGRDWHVDHCHKSGKVRGILCHHCNMMLGNARDEIIFLQEAIKYLERSSS